jgi:hypothetical protein
MDVQKATSATVGYAPGLRSSYAGRIFATDVLPQEITLTPVCCRPEHHVFLLIPKNVRFTHAMERVVALILPEHLRLEILVRIPLRMIVKWPHVTVIKPADRLLRELISRQGQHAYRLVRMYAKDMPVIAQEHVTKVRHLLHLLALHVMIPLRMIAGHQGVMV